MKNKLLLLAAGAVSFGSAAAQTGPYVGLSLGASSVTEETVTVDDPDFIPFDAEFDEGVVFGLLGGYQFNPFAAVELELTSQTNDSDVFVGEDTFNLTAVMVNGVLTTPTDEAFNVWVGAGAGIAGTNIESGGNSFAYQVKGGIDFRLAAAHRLGVQAAWLGTDGFDEEQDGQAFDFDYAATSVSITYKYRFPY